MRRQHSAFTLEVRGVVPIASLSGDPSVAVRTPNFAFADFVGKSVVCVTLGSAFGNVEYLDVAHVIEFENDQIIFTAVHARMCAQVVSGEGPSSSNRLDLCLHANCSFLGARVTFPVPGIGGFVPQSPAGGAVRRKSIGSVLVFAELVGILELLAVAALFHERASFCWITKR